MPLSPAHRETLRRTAEKEVSDCPELLALLTTIADRDGLETAIEALTSAKRIFLKLSREGKITPNLVA
jgi:hypothetical protein